MHPAGFVLLDHETFVKHMLFAHLHGAMMAWHTSILLCCPAGFVLLDHETFEVKGSWEKLGADEQIEYGYDFCE